MGKEPDLLKKKKKKKKKWPRKNERCIVTAKEICSMLILIAAVGNK